MKKMLNKLKSSKASVAMEFGIVLPILLLIILGIIQFSIISYYSSKLSAATILGSRLALTGNLYEADTREELISGAIVSEFNKSIFSVDLTKLTIKAYALNDYNFKDDELDESSLAAGGSGQFALYKVTYEPIILFPGVARFFGDGNKFLIESRVIVKNETF